MTITKLLFVSMLMIPVTGYPGAPLHGQEPTPKSATGMKDMKPQMEQMRVQMEQMRTQMAQLQVLMQDSMDKIAAAGAAMKTHMETEQASMKSQMALQQAVIAHLQVMNDHMQSMEMPDAMDMNKTAGTKNGKSILGDQKSTIPTGSKPN